MSCSLGWRVGQGAQRISGLVPGLGLSGVGLSGVGGLASELPPQALSARLKRTADRSRAVDDGERKCCMGASCRGWRKDPGRTHAAAPAGHAYAGPLSWQQGRDTGPRNATKAPRVRTTERLETRHDIAMKRAGHCPLCRRRGAAVSVSPEMPRP